MEKIFSALEEMKRINNSYDISADEISRLEDVISEAKVCVPIIGKFSSGKSALVNTVLGYRKKILKEDITPETAIPAEIVYTETDEKITIIRNDETKEFLSVDQYREYEADASTVKSARIQLCNSFLEEIQDVMLVDMPGFDSGFEIHNKAIDNYLPQSMVYIIVFPADDMIVRSNIGNILKELCLYDMPLCVAITKCDKQNDDFEITFEKMKESLKKFVGNRELRYCKTSSFKGDAEELEEFLREIQEKSQDILVDRYKKSALSIIGNTENYLVRILKGRQMTESEREEEEEKIHRQIVVWNSEFSEERQSFDSEAVVCIEEIKSDVQIALEAEEPTLIIMVMNKQSINEHLNVVVRNAVTVSVKKRFIPRVEKYFRRVAKILNSESLGDIQFSFDFDFEKMNKGIVSSIVAAAVGSVVGWLVGGAIVGLITAIFAKRSDDARREREKLAISQKLRLEVFPQVLSEVRDGVEKKITEQKNLINKLIEDDIEKQNYILEKAISDSKQKKEMDEKFYKNVEEDLKKIQELKDDLR